MFQLQNNVALSENVSVVDLPENDMEPIFDIDVTALAVDWNEVVIYEQQEIGPVLTVILLVPACKVLKS